MLQSCRSCVQRTHRLPLLCREMQCPIRRRGSVPSHHIRRPCQQPCHASKLLRSANLQHRFSSSFQFLKLLTASFLLLSLDSDFLQEISMSILVSRVSPVCEFCAMLCLQLRSHCIAIAVRKKATNGLLHSHLRYSGESSYLHRGNLLW